MHSNEPFTQTAATQPILTFHGWDYAIVVAGAVLCLVAFLYVWNRKHLDGRAKSKGYVVTPWFNAAALVIAAFAARYPILQSRWLPETALPDLGQYAFRMATWFLVVLAVLRFAWTLLTLSDSDRLYLTGDHDTGQDPEEVAQKLELPTRAMEKAEMVLLDKHARSHLMTLKSRGYYWGLFAYMALVAQRVSEFRRSYIAYVWQTTNLRRNVPDAYWKLVRQAIRDRQPAEDLENAMGAAYYIRRHNVVILIAGKDGSVVTKRQVVSLMGFFDAFWNNL